MLLNGPADNIIACLLILIMYLLNQNNKYIVGIQFKIVDQRRQVYLNYSADQINLRFVDKQISTCDELASPLLDRLVNTLKAESVHLPTANISGRIIPLVASL